jgi:tetratricopeptide (TPR) repeat protein
MILYALSRIFSIMTNWSERLKKTKSFLKNDSKGLLIDGIESGFRDDYEEAIEYFDKALYSIVGTTETSINANFYKAVALVELDKHDEAIEIFKKILKHDKDNDAAWQNLGYTYNHIENYVDAKKCFENAIKLDPEDVTSLIGKAEACFELEENNVALDITSKILEIEPDNVDTLFLKCEILIEMNQSEGVFEIIKNIDDDEDLIPEKKSMEAIVHGTLGNNVKALECINEAIQYESDDENSWWNKACYLSLLDRKEEANDALLISTSIEPENLIDLKDEKDFDNIKNTERFQKLFNQSV